jgi:hypothetical protein
MRIGVRSRLLQGPVSGRFRMPTRRERSTGHRGRRRKASEERTRGKAVSAWNGSLGSKRRRHQVGYRNITCLTARSGRLTVGERWLGQSSMPGALLMNGDAQGRVYYPAFALPLPECIGGLPQHAREGRCRSVRPGGCLAAFGPNTRSNFDRPFDIPYRGLKLPRISAALGLCYLRCGGRFAAGGPSAGPSLFPWYRRLRFCYVRRCRGTP